MEVACSEAMLALCFYTLLLVKCLMKRLGRSARGKMVGNIFGGCLFEIALTIRCYKYYH